MGGKMLNLDPFHFLFYCVLFICMASDVTAGGDSNPVTHTDS